MALKLPKAIDPQAVLRELEKRRCAMDLSYFIRKAWSIVEPGAPYVENWHIDFICRHLEAITNEEIVDEQYYNRLLINVPPGMMKSLLVAVFWPAWEWGPKNMPHMRYLCLSHDAANSIRDSLRMRRLVSSEWYQSHWGDHVKIVGDQNVKTHFENAATGFRQVTSFDSVTGKRGDRILLDDPNSWNSANSEQQRLAVNEWFLGALQSRLNQPAKSAIIVIMQRLHEEDVSGVILEHGGTGLGYDHIMLPMRYDPSRNFTTKLGYRDPRTEEGELLFEARFPDSYVDRIERIMNPNDVAGQHQQSPYAKGGNIIKDDWWKVWAGTQLPLFDYILASVDTAYTTDQENDYSAMTIWGVFTTAANENGKEAVTNTQGKSISRDGRLIEFTRREEETAPKLMLLDAWQDRLEFHQLIERIAKTCRGRNVDKIIIENKAAGISVAQELRRVFRDEPWGVQLIDTKRLDKVARLNSIAHIFSEGMVWAPNRDYVTPVIRQVNSFPKGKHDDLVDTVSQAIRHLRDIGMLTRFTERVAEIEQSKLWTGKAPAPLYPI